MTVAGEPGVWAFMVPPGWSVRPPFGDAQFWLLKRKVDGGGGQITLFGSAPEEEKSLQESLFKRFGGGGAPESCITDPDGRWAYFEFTKDELLWTLAVRRLTRVEVTLIYVRQPDADPDGLENEVAMSILASVEDHEEG